MPRAEDSQTVAEKIITSVAGRYEAADRIFTLTINVGIALYPTSADDPAGLMRNAATATLAAREKGVDAIHFGCGGGASLLRSLARLAAVLQISVCLSVSLTHLQL